MKVEGKEVGRINYAELESRQQERFNFQKAGAVLADYGFAALKLDDDWNGADFLAHHISGEITLKIQLKGRLSFGKKYEGKNIYVMFQGKHGWYLYPHDEALEKVALVCNLKNTDSWIINGGYNMGRPSEDILSIMKEYLIEP